MRIHLILCATLALGSQALAANADGAWSITGTTDVGACQKAFSGVVTVRNNDIVSSSEADTQVLGAIDAKGAVWARFTRKGAIVRANGQFRGDSASGAWSSSTALCGGRWKAVKQH